MKVAVLGAGHGGHAMTADLSMGGHQVNFYEHPKFSEKLKPMREKGGIDLTAKNFSTGQELILPGGGKTGFAKVNGKITDNAAEAVRGVDVIMLVVPAFAREAFAKEFIPHLQDGQIIVVWPGYFGALQLNHLLKKSSVSKDVTLCEAESLIYACTNAGPAKAVVRASKMELQVAALPAKKTKAVLEVLENLYPTLSPAKNVLDTTLRNINLPLHPAANLVNVVKIEKKEYPYDPDLGGYVQAFYDVTPAMAKLMEGIDRDRIALGKALGLQIPSLRESLKTFYGAEGKDTYEAVLHSHAYQKLIAPTSINYRYVTEDIPFGLVPLASLGRAIAVPTPVCDSLITLASTMCETDFSSRGLTQAQLGVEGLSREQIVQLVT